LQVTVDRSNFCAAAGVGTTSDTTHKRYGNQEGADDLHDSVLNDNPGGQRLTP
jgi:hypothetical protein